MQNPTDLIRFETDTDELAGQPGPLLVVLDGFIDAGHTGRLLADHLLAESEGSIVASFDLDQLIDFRGRRPAMVFESARWASYDDPALLLHRLHDRDGVPYYLLTGPEPDYQWERVIEAIRFLIDRLEITVTLTAHGIPMAVPHTRPLGMTTHANQSGIVAETTSVFGTVQVPASLSALLEMRLGEVGVGVGGFAVHVPHYLTQSDFHEAALTALGAVTDTTGLSLPNDALVAAAGANRAAIAQEVAANEEVGEAVSSLERQYDAFMEGRQRPSLLAHEPSDVPSADEIGAEFEEFLRAAADDDRGTETP